MHLNEDKIHINSIYNWPCRWRNNSIYPFYFNCVIIFLWNCKLRENLFIEMHSAFLQITTDINVSIFVGNLKLIIKIRTEDKHKIDEKLSDNTIQEENVMNDATQQRDSCKYWFFIYQDNSIYLIISRLLRDVNMSYSHCVNPQRWLSNSYHSMALC